MTKAIAVAASILMAGAGFAMTIAFFAYNDATVVQPDSAVYGMLWGFFFLAQAVFFATLSPAAFFEDQGGGR